MSGLLWPPSYRLPVLFPLLLCSLGPLPHLRPFLSPSLSFGPANRKQPERSGAARPPEPSVCTHGGLAVGGGHFLFMRTTGPPGAVPWTGLWSSPFSLDLSPPSGGPHISVQVPSSYGIQALPSLCAAGEGGKGGGVRSLQTARNVGVERPECPQEASPAPGPSPPQFWVYRPTFLLPLLL